MNSTPMSPGTSARWIKWFLVVVAVVLPPTFLAIGITGYFRLSRDAQCLRNCVTQQIHLQNGTWARKIELHVGPLTCGAIRTGLSFFHVQPEVDSVLRAVRGAEVGIYELSSTFDSLDTANLLDTADLAMSRRGWERMIGVKQESEFVAIYVPKDGCSTTSMRACLAVLNEHQLVVVSARSNLEPLVDMALRRTDWRGHEGWHARL